MPTVAVHAKLVACEICHMVKLIHQQSTRMKCPHCGDFTGIIVIQENLVVQIPVPVPEWPE